MPEIKFGHRSGPGHGKELPVAASQYFHNKGGHFVYLSAGNVTLAASGSLKLAGWAEGRKEAAGYKAWKSSGTAEDDTMFVITGVNDVYELPWYDSSGASLAASLVGLKTGLRLSGSTYTTKQYATTYVNTTGSPLTIVDVDVTNKTVFVKINPDKKQAV